MTIEGSVKATSATTDYAPVNRDDSGAKVQRHHLMIGGTGRAGTSFLVRYLHLCGMDTMMAREGLASWNDDANAGLETYPASKVDMPYVIKSAWFHEFVDDFFKDPTRKLDAVLVPMRDLVEAASSRIINDQVARFRDPAVPDQCTTWERWGTTPGGVVYSLNPIDQARILSLSFHSAIHNLVRHDVPLVFLDFPRFIEDADYLYDKLTGLLPAACDRLKAALAHSAIADASKVRTGREVRAVDAATGSAEAVTEPGITYPAIASLNQAARSRAQRQVRRPAGLAHRLLRRVRRAFG